MGAAKSKQEGAGTHACGVEDHVERPHPPRRPRSEYVAAASLLNAAGDVARLRLIVRLAEGERCVSELARGSGVTFGAVSQQLAFLKSARIVSSRREGRHVYYALADAHIVELIRSALDHVEE